MNGNKTSGILIRLQARYVIIGLFLTNASIEILSDAFAGSASAPLGIATTVVNSCKFTTVSPLVVPASLVSINIVATNFSPVVDLACSHGLRPRIAFSSRTQETGAVLTGSTMTVASEGIREVLTESSPNQKSTPPEKVRGMKIPQKDLAPKMITLPGKYYKNSGQNVSIGNYTDYVVVTVNF